MRDSVIIKGNKYGLTLHINEEASLDDIKKELIEKLGVASNFFKNGGNIAITFEGRNITIEEKQELIDIINTNSDINIMCIVDNDPSKEELFKNALSSLNKSPDPQLEEQVVPQDGNASTGCFHKGTLRSGQLLESDTSIVILGDVNPGANIVAKGNIVVLGTLKGNAYAGTNGDENCFVAALGMHPMQIRIADTIARCPDDSKNAKKMEPQIAYISENNICIENLY